MAAPAENLSSPKHDRFSWEIEDFSTLPEKLYSEYFSVGDYSFDDNKWRIVLFRMGNGVDHLSMYLENVADSTTLWNSYAEFTMTVVNQINEADSIKRETQHQFDADQSEWGFDRFMPLAELYDPSKGYLENDKFVVEGHIVAVYHMPTTENDMPSGSIPLALQSLFYKLQYSDRSVATEDLTKSFGWDTRDSLLKHDVHEFTRVLCETLENKMRGTAVEGTIQQLFEGHHMNYIECINVDYKSEKKESFYDLQLGVKGCRDVYDSFDRYVEVEQLEGDNKYHAGSYGLQEARKGVFFIDFPPILQLQLQRLEYDSTRGTMVKINDYYEFPLQLDLDRDNGKYLSPEANRSIRNLYTLQSVLVHSGGVDCGHYYAYIRPTISDQWFKFDDVRVTKEDAKSALKEQYGGENELPPADPMFSSSDPVKFPKCSNAYMLVYIRDCDKDKIICNVDDEDIAQHLRQRIEEEKFKEEEEAHGVLWQLDI